MKILPVLPVLGLFTFIVGCFSQSQPTKNSDEKKMENLSKTVVPDTLPGGGKAASIVLGGGCFWCTEAVYQELRGVLKVESGYAGGSVKDPTYREICTGLTGHAEVIKITFDPSAVNLEDILAVFFTVHDPTTLNRQGNDVGTQYRSVIFYASEAEKAAAEKMKNAAQTAWDDPIVTEISPLPTFYRAEDYHQNYWRDNPNQGYCSFIITPKVSKFRKQWADKLKK